MEMCQRKCLVAEFGQIKGLVRYYLKTKHLASKTFFGLGVAFFNSMSRAIDVLATVVLLSTLYGLGLCPLGLLCVCQQAQRSSIMH